MRQDSDDAPSAPDTALPRFVLQAVAGFPVVLRLCIHQTLCHDLYLMNLALSTILHYSPIFTAIPEKGKFTLGGRRSRTNREKVCPAEELIYPRDLNLNAVA